MVCKKINKIIQKQLWKCLLSFSHIFIYFIQKIPTDFKLIQLNLFKMIIIIDKKFQFVGILCIMNRTILTYLLINWYDPKIRHLFIVRIKDLLLDYQSFRKYQKRELYYELILKPIFDNINTWTKIRFFKICFDKVLRESMKSRIKKGNYISE